jgi:lipoprotein-anchoring transpeptidase ErfK/SrfK
MLRAVKLSLVLVFLGAALALAAQPPAQNPAPPHAVPAPAPPAPAQPVPVPPAPGQPVPGQPAPPRPVPAVPGQAVPAPPPQVPAGPPGPGDVQVLLDRLGLSPGPIDGRDGTNTRKALAVFQETHRLPPTGRLDGPTWNALAAATHAPAWATYTITPEDAAGPFVPTIPEDMDAKAKLPSLGYTSVLEMLGERFHASPKLLQQLNPGARFVAGETLRVPNVRPAGAAVGAAAEAKKDVRLVVSKSKLSLTVARGDEVLFYAPVTAGSEHDPLPIGHWKITGVSRNPKFHYNPDLFWDADATATKATIPPGPNNPVGVVWMDLDKKHYGIHGTPEPERIGKTQSHGCVRLTNWDAETVAAFVKPGTPVDFVE